MSSTKPLRPRRIGFIGKASVSPREAGMLMHIGQCIALMGHTVVMVPAVGAATALREGVEIQGGRLELLTGGTVESADFTQVYPDPQLLERLKQKYEDIETRSNVLIIKPDQLDRWYDAVRVVVAERGLTPPSRAGGMVPTSDSSKTDRKTSRRKSKAGD